MEAEVILTCFRTWKVVWPRAGGQCHPNGGGTNRGGRRRQRREGVTRWQGKCGLCRKVR